VTPATELRAVCERLRTEKAAAVAVHENPDLDALGSAVGLIDLLHQLGAAASLHLSAAEHLPSTSFGPTPDTVLHIPPAAGSTLYAVDTGSLPRMALDLEGWQGDIVNIDHHHDNTRFGLLNLVMPRASSVSEIVCLLADELELRPSPAAAAALYAGISFDTGHFRHASTGPATFRCAARLVKAGADPTAIYSELYERRTLADARLWAAAMQNARAVAGGRALVSMLTRADFAASGAPDDAGEGLVEALRALRGVQVAALVKEQDGGHRTRVSLRSSGWDVSALAAERGGGGHRQAAGFSSGDGPEEVAEWLSSVLAERLSTASS
jgi:bifunctional oligoribonuclease and PAP phosphatase NrnA